MNLELRIYDKSAERMLYSHEPEGQGKREYCPFEFGIGFSHWKKEDLSPIMLFTEIYDCQNNKIWEEDILSDELGNKWIVKYMRGSFWFVDFYNNTNYNTFDWLVDNGYWVGYKVVGNLYEGVK